LMHSQATMNRAGPFPFLSKYTGLEAVVADHELAALGDAYVNFVYSLALSEKLGKPVGRKLDSSTLASALKRAGLRKILPSRMDRHKQADAAEALVVYAWLVRAVSLEETVGTIVKAKAPEDGFVRILRKVARKIEPTHKKV